jgi:hypothetical protein
MLRLFALLLLVANGLFFAWSSGLLSQWGLASSSKNESFRLKEQIEPERIVIKPKDALQTSSAANTAQVIPEVIAPVIPTACLSAGVFNDKQSAVLKQALSTKLPDLRWRFEETNIPARWIVYMGKYPNNTMRDLKKSQLDQIKVSYEVLTEGSLEPGLSLGNHATQIAANQALQQLFKQGVRTARVLQESPDQKGQTLVLPALDEASRSKLNTVYGSFAAQLGNKSLQVCK